MVLYRQENIFRKLLLDMHFQNKSDKNGIFDVVTSCSIFVKKKISSKIRFNICCYNGQLLSVLGLVLYDFEKCLVSLVVKYTSNFSTILNKHPTFSRKLPF